MLLGINSLAFSATIRGEVIKIADGDTLTILTADQLPVKVRLVDIDAPERHQAFGTRSRQALSAMCFKKTAEVQIFKLDRYGRIVGRVFCDNKDTSVEQVKSGMAWVYDQYVTDLSLYPLQNNAKEKKLGLWKDNDPVPPWDFRKNKKNLPNTSQ